MTQLGLDWSPRRASQEARDALTPARLREDHRRILDALQACPLSDEEIRARTGVHPNAIRARRGELVEMGMVEAVTDRAGLSASGRRVTLWRVK
jgi:predicted ArsR family transcriptional regulator